MVNKRKTRLMARTAMYEKHEGNKAFRRTSFFKGDYVGVHMLIAGASVTLAYLLVLGMVAVYKFDYIIDNLTNINYRDLFSKLILIYVVVLIAYMIVSYFVYAFRYEDDAQGVRMYLGRLKKIHTLNKEEKNAMAYADDEDADNEEEE